MRKIVLVLTSSLVFTHCTTTSPKVVDTQAYKGKTIDERKQAYIDNGITPGTMFKPYRVGQETFAADALSPLFGAPYASEATRNKYSSAEDLGLVTSIFGATGGFLIGWNTGTALRGADTSVGVWVGGCASILVALVFGRLANADYADASIMYNNDLYDALELRQKTSAVKPPEEFAHYAFSSSHTLEF